MAPTILDLLGADRFPCMHGQSLRPYLEGGKPAAPRDHIFSEYLENEEACIRTARWKYIHCSGKRERTDGYETDNPTPGRYDPAVRSAEGSRRVHGRSGEAPGGGGANFECDAGDDSCDASGGRGRAAG